MLKKWDWKPRVVRVESRSVEAHEPGNYSIGSDFIGASQSLVVEPGADVNVRFERDRLGARVIVSPII